MSFQYTIEHLKQIRVQPHILGLIAGKNKLTSLHSQWIRYLWDTNEHLSLQAHRGSYKTTAVTVIGSIWWLLFHPEDRVAIIRKTATDASAVLHMISLIMQDPGVKALFALAHGKAPKPTLKQGNQLSWDFKTIPTPEASITGHGLDGSLTGKHYDKIMLDDVITMKDRISRAERERTKEVLREIYTNIIDPGKSVAHAGTPWHRDDAWQDAPNPIQKYSVSDCGLLSPAEIAQKKKTTTPFLYSANYDLEITTAQDMLFKDPFFLPWDYTVRTGIYSHIDAAFQGTHTCALTIMARKPDGRIQAIGHLSPGNIKDWITDASRLMKRRLTQELFMETNPDKGYSLDKFRDTKVIPRCTDYQEKQNKTLKISSILYEAWDSIDWDPDTDPEYMNQILDWREGMEPDDAPDSAATLLREKFLNLGAKKSTNYWASMTAM